MAAVSVNTISKPTPQGKALTATLRALDKSFVKVGWPGENTKIHTGGINMAGLAMIHEFGSPKRGIPARPVLKQTAQATLPKQKKLCATLLNQIEGGRLTPHQALARLGEWYVGSIKTTFTTGNFRPLAPATILRKHSSRPLIDTGQLRGSVTARVVLNGRVV